MCDMRMSNMPAGMTGPSGLLKPGMQTDKSKINRATVKRVAASFRPYRPQVVGIAISVLLSASLGLLSPFFLKIIVNDGLIAKNLSVVNRYSIYTLLATIGSTVFALYYGYQSIVVGQQIMRDYRNQLYTHLQGMSMKFFTDTRTGEIQSRLTNDVGGVQSVVSDTAATLLNNITTVLSTVVAMIYMDWRLTLLSVGILPLFAFIGQRVGIKARAVRVGHSAAACRPQFDHAADFVDFRNPPDEDERTTSHGDEQVQ